MPRFFILAICLFLCLAPQTSASTSAGFVEGIWYSTTTPVANQPVRIYAAIRNNTGADITGTVVFFDNQHEISRSPVAALNGRVIESWADWIPTTGHHTITAQLANVEAHAIGKPAIPTAVTNAVASSSVAIAPPPPKVTSPPTSARSASAAVGTPSAHTNRVGLEHYLPASPATVALRSITNLTHQAKQAVDAYQAARAAAIAPPAGLSQLDIPVNQNGFGTVTRSMQAAAPKAQIPHDAFGTALRVLGAAWTGLVTYTIAGTAWALGYPILIQLLALLGIPYLLYRTARRYGKRRFQ